jgi:hypothetical protein
MNRRLQGHDLMNETAVVERILGEGRADTAA